MYMVIKDDKYLTSFKDDKPVWSDTNCYIFKDKQESENYANLFGGSSEMYVWTAGSEREFWED